MSSEKPKPYQQPEAVVDALAGLEACKHGIWPHQGECSARAKELKTIEFSFAGLFSRDVQ